MKYTVGIVGVSLAAFLALVGAALSQDSLFQAHMWVLFFALAGGAVLLLRQHSFMPAAPAPARSSVHSEVEYMDGPIRFGVIATMFWAINRPLGRRGHRRAARLAAAQFRALVYLRARAARSTRLPSCSPSAAMR